LSDRQEKNLVVDIFSLNLSSESAALEYIALKIRVLEINISMCLASGQESISSYKRNNYAEKREGWNIFIWPVFRQLEREDKGNSAM